MHSFDVLIACEESQAVTKEMRKLGIDAFSCDIEPCSGGHPEWHVQGDVLPLFNREWGMIIAFPPCTDLAISGARYFEMKRNNGTQRKSIKFFLDVWKLSDCTENPIGILNTPNYLKKWFPDLFEYALSIKFPFKPSQIIHPYMFGHTEQKSTCLWLKKLPKLIATNNVKNEMLFLPKKVRERVHYLPPSVDRAKLRSKTFPGIAQAMADQWGNYLLQEKTK